MPHSTQTIQKQTKQALILLWIVPALWSVNYIVARMAPGVIGPHLLALGRWGLAALVLVVLARSELWANRANIAKAWWQYLILGALGMLICGAWVYQGARSTQAMNIALIYAASPVLISLGSVWMLNESINKRQILGVFLALFGVVHVVVKGQWAAMSNVQFVVGDLWIVAATIAWAGYALLQKKWPSPLSATARLAAICLGGVASLLPFSIWELFQPGLTVWGAQAFWLIVIAGLVPGLGAYWIYGWAQKILGASRTAVALYLGPLYAAFLTWAFLGEAPGWHHLFGGLLILPGVFLVMMQSKK
jgi:drug/metabolite transporter (DMT)-like permease